jgi:hypothetical protein
MQLQEICVMIVILDTPESRDYSTVIRFCFAVLCHSRRRDAFSQFALLGWSTDVGLFFSLSCFRCFLVIILFTVNIDVVTNCFTFAYLTIQKCSLFCCFAQSQLQANIC